MKKYFRYILLVGIFLLLVGTINFLYIKKENIIPKNIELKGKATLSDWDYFGEVDILMLENDNGILKVSFISPYEEVVDDSLVKAYFRDSYKPLQGKRSYIHSIKFTKVSEGEIIFSGKAYGMHGEGRKGNIDIEGRVEIGNR